MRVFSGMTWQVGRWSRNSAVFTLSLLGVSALIVGPDSEDVKAALAAAIATLAVAAIDWKTKSPDELLCKLAPILLAAVAAWLALAVEAGEEWRYLVGILGSRISVFSSTFAIQLMVANVWPSLKQLLTKS